MNLYDVIKKPVITESSMAQLEAGKYVFEVDTRAHKLLIKQAVEAAFEGVKVANVNTINVKPKAKRVGRYTGFTNKTKKAIITLTADSKAIELFAAAVSYTHLTLPTNLRVYVSVVAASFKKKTIKLQQHSTTKLDNHIQHIDKTDHNQYQINTHYILNRITT